MTIAVVTDSTASLPSDVTSRLGITVVPLQVVIGADEYDDGSDEASPARIAAALREFKPVSTSRPSPAAFLDAYRVAEKAGAKQIVSVHISGQMSGTFEAAQIAARDASVRVICVDTQQVGVATGFAAVAAAEAIDAGRPVEDAADIARKRAQAATSLFYVDTLEYLRRGGRMGAAAALMGSALAVKPLLAIEDGVVATKEKVRTSSRALARLEELALEAAGDQPVDAAVTHLANPDRAATLTKRLQERLEENLRARTGGKDREVRCAELGSVLGAHVGPGMIAVCISPRT